ncbi:CC171 protein, partial [Ptilonorhynchus violaceus]|nr:CC171 protein [Ptilonorhynchus violaceus]
EGLSWTELCVLLHENVDALISNFHRAKDKITRLEHVCKDKTDSMKHLLQSQEDAFEEMNERFKAQEHCWQKEKKHLEQQYTTLLAEVHTREQEYEETAQRNREKMYSLEQDSEKLARENASLKNTLKNAQQERSSLLAACALLSGALCPLYSRLCAMSSQRDLLQDQANLRDLANEKIVSLLRALPAEEANSQDEMRLRQRRATGLIYVFRRAVIAVLAACRLKVLAQSSCSLLVWTSGSKGGIGIPVCVGESRGRRSVSRFEEDRVDCVEALDWLTSSNLHSAIISSVSELQEVLN